MDCKIKAYFKNTLSIIFLFFMVIFVNGCKSKKNIDITSLNKTERNKLVEELTEKINKSPDSKFDLEKRAELFTYNGNDSAAIQDYNKLLKMDSLNSEYYLNRGYCYREINIDKSITDITKSILLNNRLGKNNSTNYAFRFSEYFYAGRFKKCLSDLSEKIKLDRTMPNESLNYFYRSLCYFYLKDFDNAIKDAEKSNSLDVSKPNIIWLIKLYIADSKYDKALSLLDSYKERKADPGKAYYHYIRGILNEQLGYSNLAAVDFRKSVILKGKYKYDITFYPAIELGFIYYKNKSIDSSLKYIKESIGEGFCDFNNPKIKMMEQNKRIRTYIKNYKKSSKYLSQLKSEEEINEILKRGKIMNEKELEKVSSISTGALPLKENLDNCIRLNKLVWQYQML